jgi:hypothetical protein
VWIKAAAATYYSAMNEKLAAIGSHWKEKQIEPKKECNK